MTKRLPWTREETILAGAAAEKVSWRGVNSNTPVVLELSSVLKQFPIHSLSDRAENFRSPSSVGRKINSMRAARPDYVGVGLRVIPLEADVALRFLENPHQMKREASRICNRYGCDPTNIL